MIACTGEPGKDIREENILPSIDPDYSNLIIPSNIAPLNFRIAEEGKAYFVRISSDSKLYAEIVSRDGIIKVPERKWKRMLLEEKGGEFKIEIFVLSDKIWHKYRTIVNTISPEPIDRFLTYRLLYPGYESWNELSIKQRDLESFREKSLIENSLVNENCINCHAYNNNGTDGSFLFHMRGNMGGTYFYSGGDFRKINLKAKEMKNGAVYPRWHPSGKFVAFSSNSIIQQFHSAFEKKVEVSDLESSIVLYDVERNEIMDLNIKGEQNHLDTYPEWSPDGKYLYFCRAAETGGRFVYDSVRYDLWRTPFDASERKTGAPELVYNASAINKSVSFPRISPDGKFLVVTLHDYGCFPIWHKEADLFSIDLRNLKSSTMALNSNFTDSYHSWSSNSRWLVFSSRRDNGLTTRLYISYIDNEGTSSKPFILPGKDPDFYGNFLKSFNVPELSAFEIKVQPGKLYKRAREAALQARWVTN